jgi:hypothetical protein
VTTTVLFYSNGNVQAQSGVAAGSIGSSGTIRCGGRYQFNGQMLSVGFASCVTCSNGCMAYPWAVQTMNSQFRGPVQPVDQYTININGALYRRQ